MMLILIHAAALIQNYEIKQNSSPIGGKRAYFYRKKNEHRPWIK